MIPPDRRPMEVHCGDCKHTWAALYTPLPLADVAKILRNQRCPLCAAEPDRIFCGPAKADPTPAQPPKTRKPS